MPELPEVEGARRLVKRNCVGKRITKAIIGDDDSESGGSRALAGWQCVRTRTAPTGHRHPPAPLPPLLPTPWRLPPSHHGLLSTAEVIAGNAPRELERALEGRSLVQALEAVERELAPAAP